jgi:beta-phosphoglucomutase-like phosphatase (HAD superfamily)
MKHTPGPWRIWDEFVLAGGTGREGRIITANIDRIHYECQPDNEANAKLIAAAPDLLAALRELHDFACPLVVSRNHERSCQAFRKAAELLGRLE